MCFVEYDVKCAFFLAECKRNLFSSRRIFTAETEIGKMLSASIESGIHYRRKCVHVRWIVSKK